MVALGLVLLVTAGVCAAQPYRQTREFGAVMACDRGSGACFGDEPGTITGRRTYTTESTHTDANGTSSTTTTTHYEVTWQRADGSRQARDVSTAFYAKAREGEPANLRLWRAEVVGVEVMGESQWFLPQAGKALKYWLYLAFFGLGVVLWGLLCGWWDGFFMLAFRTFSWMFIIIVPVSIVTGALAGLHTTTVWDIFAGVFFVFVAGGMLLASLAVW